MSTTRLQKLVGRAVISDDFREGLMSERRAELLRQSNLEPEELAAVLSIRATNFAEFAAAIETMAEVHESTQSVLYHVEPHWPRGIIRELTKSDLHA
jgi:hypothetical protein